MRYSYKYERKCVVIVDAFLLFLVPIMLPYSATCPFAFRHNLYTICPIIIKIQPTA